MSFNKRIASEEAKIVNPNLAEINRVFAKLEKEEATEFEVLRAAKILGLTITSLKEVCTISNNGLLRPKVWGEFHGN